MFFNPFSLSHSMTPLKDISSRASREWRITATASETFLWSENSIKGKLLPPGKVKKKNYPHIKKSFVKRSKITAS
jgi:hypothetical protein